MNMEYLVTPKCQFLVSSSFFICDFTTEDSFSACLVHLYGDGSSATQARVGRGRVGTINIRYNRFADFYVIIVQ